MEIHVTFPAPSLLISDGSYLPVGYPENASAGLLRDTVVLTAGYEHLSSAYPVKDEILPSGVEFRQDVVEQQHGALARVFGKDLPLRHLDRQGRSTGLSL